MKIPLYCYLAFNNPEGSVSVIKDFGYEILNTKSRSDIAECLRQFILREKEAGLNALARIHPDRQLILDNPDVTVGANGTSEPDIPASSQAVISQPANPMPSPKSETNYIPVLIGCILTAGMFVSAAMIATKAKN
jgi:hypothetical protein